MSNKDLVLAASKIRNVTRCRNTMGERGVLGVRVQPNHPADDLGGILLSAVDGLLFGCGDAVIGVNPATESVETVAAILHGLDRLIDALGDPDAGVLPGPHHARSSRALDRGAPVDLLFQSVAGTQAANASFGITLALLREGRERVLEQHRRARRGLGRRAGDVLRDRAGQRPVGRGASRRRSAHAGGPRLRRGPRVRPVPGQQRRRLHRPGVSATTSGRSSGPGWRTTSWASCSACRWACDVCYTNHAAADQNSADNLLLLLAAAGCNYFMGVPCADDVMLNYQSTSYHDAAGVRRLFGLRPAPEFLAWLEGRGIFRRAATSATVPAAIATLGGSCSRLESVN